VEYPYLSHLVPCNCRCHTFQTPSSYLGLNFKLPCDIIVYAYNSLSNKVNKSELEEEIIKPETHIHGPHGTSLKGEESKRNSRTGVTNFQLPKVVSAMTSISDLEQITPADAVLAKAGAAEVSKGFHYAESRLMELFLYQFLQDFDPAVMPLGIITLEDVLEGSYLLESRSLSNADLFTHRTYRRRDMR
jgi:hypothetical protein